jgi:hypothetical protein
MATGTATASVIPIDLGAMRVHTSREEAGGTPLGTSKQRRESYTSVHVGETTFLAREASKDAQRASSTPRLSQSELYPVRHAFSPQHITALRLLALAAGRTQRALSAMNDGDEIAADSEVQKVQMLLPELFCCRTLGDGFGAVVSAVMSAFESLQGNPLNAAQLNTMNRVFSLLRNKPFLSADEADQQLEKLEAVHLSPYPTELVEFLSSDKSVR